MKQPCPAAHLNMPSSTAECCLLENNILEHIFLEKQPQIERWLRLQFQETPPVITSSVDLRNEGFRLAPVDTNLFPAGFNNLNPNFLPLCIQAAQSTIISKMPRCTRILIIPENHTRNPFYFESLVNLHAIFSKAGFEVRIGSLLETLIEPQEISHGVFLEPIMRDNNRLKVGDFDPCMLLLNNDLSAGVPELLENLEQRIYPALQLGWGSRLKTQHFAHYQQVAEDFAEHMHIDPWRIAPFFDACGDIDFMAGVGMDVVAEKVDALILKIRQKYQQYQINQEPFVVVKADAGTYGMGILMVKSGEELLALNRKQRTKMSTSKGNQKIEKVIIQEGVYTFETAGTPPNDGVAEPVIYMIGQYVIGGFYRIHKDKRVDENLNMPGMHFEPLSFNAACNNPEKFDSQQVSPCSNRFYSYGVVARLAGLAAAREAAAWA